MPNNDRYASAEGFYVILKAGSTLEALAIERGYAPRTIIDANVGKSWYLAEDNDGTTIHLTPTEVFLPHKRAHSADFSTGTSPSITVPARSDPTCPFCGQPPKHGKGWHCLYTPAEAETDPTGKSPGKQVGTNQRELDTNKLIENMWGEGKVNDFYAKNFFYMGKGSFAVHHIMSVSRVRESFWRVMFRHNGYNINCGDNLVTLPSCLATACELAVPLHRSNHYGNPEREGFIDVDESEPGQYHKAVKEELDILYEQIVNGDLCRSGPDGAIRTAMEDSAKTILELVCGWTLLLTKHGRFFDPRSKKGCCGRSTLRGAGPNSPNCPVRGAKDGDNPATHRESWAQFELPANYGLAQDRMDQAKSMISSASTIAPGDTHFIG